MTQLKPVHLYTKPEIYAMLAELAKANHRSMSAEMQVLIEQAHARYSLTKSKD